MWIQPVPDPLAGIESARFSFRPTRRSRVGRWAESAAACGSFGAFRLRCRHDAPHGASNRRGVPDSRSRVPAGGVGVRAAQSVAPVALRGGAGHVRHSCGGRAYRGPDLASEAAAPGGSLPAVRLRSHGQRIRRVSGVRRDNYPQNVVGYGSMIPARTAQTTNSGAFRTCALRYKLVRYASAVL